MHKSCILIEHSTSANMLPLLAPPHGRPGHQLHHPQRARGARQQHHQLHRHQRRKVAGERSLFKGETLPDQKLGGVPGAADHSEPGVDGGERVGLLGRSHLPLPPGCTLANTLSHLCPLCNIPPCLHDGAAPGEIVVKGESKHCS